MTQKEQDKIGKTPKRNEQQALYNHSKDCKEDSRTQRFFGDIGIKNDMKVM